MKVQEHERGMELDEVERAANAKVGYLTSRLFVVLALVAAPLTNCATQKPPQATAAAQLAPGDFLVDGNPQGGGRATRLPPAVPGPLQKRPHGTPPACDKKEYLINGACYRRAHPDDFSPPCEEPTVEWQGSCFFAIQEKQRPGTSMGR